MLCGIAIGSLLRDPALGAGRGPAVRPAGVRDRDSRASCSACTGPATSWPAGRVAVCVTCAAGALFIARCRTHRAALSLGARRTPGVLRSDTHSRRNPWTSSPRPSSTTSPASALARIATASAAGEPDVAAVGFSVDGGTVVTGGFDITKTVRYRNLLANPRATIVIDDLASVDPWAPRGVKVRGAASDRGGRGGGLRIRITPETVWSWSLNTGADTVFRGIERREIPRG